MTRSSSTSRRRFCVAILGLAVFAVGSLAIPTEASAAIPRGDSYRVEYSRSIGRWFNGGTYDNYNDAFRAANRYKLQSYAVRIYREPGNHYSTLPPIHVNPTKRHAPRP